MEIEKSGLIPKNKKRWTNLKNSFSPLDMVFFRGGEIISSMISKIEKLTTHHGEWTHVGILVSSDILPNQNLELNTWYVWESTFSSSKVGGEDVNVTGTHGGKFGVQLRKLDDLVPHYLSKKGTKIGWVKLLNNPWLNTQNLNKLISDFEVIFEKYNDINYDYNPLSLLGSFVKPLRHHNDKLFCSELVATCYIELGILPKTVDPSGVLPIDFFGFDRDHEVPCLVEMCIELKL